MKSFVYRYILYLIVVPFISCNSDLRIEGTYDCADSNDPMKSIIISEADQAGFVSIYYVMESPYSSNVEQIIFAQDKSKPGRTSDGRLLLESEWGQLIFEKPQSFIFVIPSGTEINFGNAFSITAPYGEQRLEYRKTSRPGADKLAGTMISNFKNTLELAQRRELEERKRRESQAIVVEPYLCKFELDRYDRVIFRFKADLRNASQKTFIDAEFYEEYIAGENWVGEPYTRDRLATWVSFYFNKEYVLRGDYSRAWVDSGIPQVSFDNPWRPQEAKPFEITLSVYDDDAVTEGFTTFEAKSCILYFNLMVEDPDGRKIPMKMKFDLTDTWQDFINK